MAWHHPLIAGKNSPDNPMRIWIKICGTTCIEDALDSIAAGADALGFVFAESKRRVSAEQAAGIVDRLPEGVERIGVFRNHTVEHVAEVVERAKLSGVQLHGEETAEFILALRERLSGAGRIRVIQTVLVNDDFERLWAEVSGYEHLIDFVLLDAGGGSGRTFDWARALTPVSQSHKPLIVAGGLQAENVGEAIHRFAPWGVDVVSGVEREPGRKDLFKLKAFVESVRRAEQS
jgi:phosphoribosylanthranilate isomerase